MNAGDAAVKRVRRIEERRVCIRDFDGARQPLARVSAPAAWTSFNNSTALRVHTAQCPSKPPAMRNVRSPESKGREQVHDDVVVVAGVQRDLVGAARFSHGAHDVDRLIAIERRDLDRRPRSEISANPRQNSYGSIRPPTARLQIKPENRASRRATARTWAMQFGNGGGAHRAQAQQACIVAAPEREFRFSHGLRRRADQTGDFG